MDRRLARTRRLAKALIVGVGIVAAVGFLAAVVVELYAQPPARPKHEIAEVALVAAAAEVALYAVGILHLFWLTSALDCAREFGRKIALPRSAAAVFAYFTPVLGIYLPFKHLATLRDASDPGDLELPEGRREVRVLPGNPLVGLWWLAYLGSLIVATATVRSPSHMALGIVDAITAVLWIRVVGKITGRLTERARLLEAGAIGPDQVDASDDEDPDEALLRRRARTARRQSVRRARSDAARPR